MFGLHYRVGFPLVVVLGFSLRWFLLLQSAGSGACGLQESWLPGSRAQAPYCGTPAELLCSVWDLPGPGIEPVTPALAGGFFSTEPSGKSRDLTFMATL